MSRTVFSGLFWSYAQSFLQNITSFVVSIVLARLLMPKDFGVVAIIQVLIIIAQVFVSSGFGNSLVQKKDSDALDFSTVFWVSAGMGNILYILFFIMAPLIEDFYKTTELVILIRVMALRLPLASFITVQKAYITKRMEFKKFFFATLGGSLSSAVVGIYMAYAGFGAWALVTQQFVNLVMNTVILFIQVKWYPRFQFSYQRLKQLFGFGSKILISELISNLFNNIKGVIIAKVYTPIDLAFYERGILVPRTIMEALNSSLMVVLFPAMSKVQDDLERVKYYLRTAMRMSLFIIAPLMIGLAVVSRPLVIILFTERWMQSVPYLPAFCILYMLNAISSANIQAIRAIGRSDIELWLRIIKTINALIFLLLALLLFDDPVSIAYASVCSACIGCILNAYPNSKLIGYSIKEMARDFAPSIFLSIFMGGCVYLAGILMGDSIIALVIQILLGVVLYAILAKVYLSSEFIAMLNIIKGYIQHIKSSSRR